MHWSGVDLKHSVYFELYLLGKPNSPLSISIPFYGLEVARTLIMAAELKVSLGSNSAVKRGRLEVRSSSLTYPPRSGCC